MITMKQLREFVATHQDVPDDVQAVFSAPVEHFPGEPPDDWTYQNFAIMDLYMDTKVHTQVPVIRITALDEEFVEFYRPKEECDGE